jgi:hypothetical protein
MSTLLVVAVGVQMLVAWLALRWSQSAVKHLALFALHKAEAKYREADGSLDAADMARRWAFRCTGAWILSCVVVVCLWLL